MIFCIREIQGITSFQQRSSKLPSGLEPNAPMNTKPENVYSIQGLNDEEVHISRKKFGTNELHFKKENTLLRGIKRMATDPMLILLWVAASIYFISGKMGDGIFLSVAIVFQASISWFQYTRSKHALDKLNAFTQPFCKVIREGKISEIKSADLVVGDSLLVEEGSAITADGSLVQSHDFSVNESILTGESLAVFKDEGSEDNRIYSGTNVASGSGIATITAIGNQTQLGKIGSSLEQITEEKTPLEIQISQFIRMMAIVGSIVFVIFWGLNYWHSKQVLTSLLQSLTLAMSILPEEIPVAFTTFMAIGAMRLMKMGIVVKQMKTVETLGSATVICTDKTGTLTENRMSLARLYVLTTNQISQPETPFNPKELEVLTVAMWASEPIPFDPMEIALHDAYTKATTKNERPFYKLIHEYPLHGKPPMMTHVFENAEGNRIVAAKGAPEAILAVSSLSVHEKKSVHKAIQQMAHEGFRVLAIGTSNINGSDFPVHQNDLRFDFLGLVAFYDPPKENIKNLITNFYQAGIAVKIITGDNTATTQAIAKQIGLRGSEKAITGDELMKMTKEELPTAVMNNSIFTRMFPEAKLKIIESLKSNNQIVAMTGDGVNDGPALKAAHIGIAMGKKGSEIAKQAASLILIDDDLSKLLDAVAMGRKIYSNLKKAIQYIISIHIPIILTVFIPLALGWIYPNLFSPVHIIFLEIIMGPTCSIIYENEPMEQNTMLQPPKELSTSFFKWKELSTSIIQGLIITAGTLFGYQYAVQQGYNEAVTRTITFTVLITANIFLTLINRSFYYSLLTTLKYKNNRVWYIIVSTVSLVGLMLYVQPLTKFFQFEMLPIHDLLIAVGIGFVSVIWYEIIKAIKRCKPLPNESK
jgi:Ca2+-transporting ATPase